MADSRRSHEKVRKTGQGILPPPCQHLQHLYFGFSHTALPELHLHGSNPFSLKPFLPYSKKITSLPVLSATHLKIPALKLSIAILISNFARLNIFTIYQNRHFQVQFLSNSFIYRSCYQNISPGFFSLHYFLFSAMGHPFQQFSEMMSSSSATSGCSLV